VDNLTLTKSLGKGAFGEVFLTQIDGKSGYYATKRLDRAYSEREENIKRLSNEIKVMQKIHHPNIVSLIDLKKTKSHHYLVMEFCNGGDLTGCLKKYMMKYNRPFSEEIVQYLMKQIVSGLDALHSRNIMHRDLKLDNILVCFNSENDKNSLNMMRATAKITDFGFATILQQNGLAHTVLGTPTNMEPGLLNNMEQRTRNQGYDQKADIWSLGTLCYQMLVGRTPFSGTSMQDLFHKVKIGTYPLPTNLSRESIFFIEAMLQKDPNKRLSCKELLRHDFLTKSVSQFHTVNAGNIPGVVAQQGGLVNVNSGANIKIQNLGETVWDIFVQPMPSSPQIPISNQQQYAVQGMGQPRMQMNQQPMYITPQMGVQQYYQQPGVNQNVYAYYK
jgi:serine/threonine protein kinase